MDIVTVVETLASYGLLRTNKITDKYYSIYCPIHNGGKERRPSCGILLEDEYRNGRLTPAGFCHCFTCGLALPMSKLVKELFKLHPVSEDVRNHILSIVDVSSDVDDYLIPSDMMKALNSAFAVRYMQTKLNPIAKTNVSDEELQSYRYTVPYMYERGLTDELIEKYDIGVDLNYIPKGRKRQVPCITFPVRDISGKTLFIARRSIENKFFFLPSDIEKPLYGIYELPKGTSSVVITESCFNCLTSVKYGKPAIALLGTGTQHQIEQLKRLGVREFILGLDPDEAGKKGTKRLKRALKEVAIVWEFDGIPEGKDINDLTKEEFDALNLV